MKTSGLPPGTKPTDQPLLPLLALCAATLAGNLPAQTTPATTSGSEEAIVLSPFTVSSEKDTGYKATNTLGGTKMNTPIKDLPFTLDVITNDFIRDIGAQSIVDGLAYTAGVMSLDSPSHNSPNMSVRGFPSNFFLRDGIPVYRAPNWTMVDRIEVIRGASAIVYGQTQAGGVINITTKQADVERRFGSISQLVGDWSNYVTMVDFNQPLINKTLAVRFAGSITDSGGRRDFSGREGSLFFPSLTWRPAERTIVTLQFSRDINKVRGLNPGQPVSWASSVAGLHYLDQKYPEFYNSLTPAQRASSAYPPPDKLQTAQVGGPAPIFANKPWKYNIAGDGGFWNSDVKTMIASVSQALVTKAPGAIENSSLKITLSRTDDKVRGRLPLLAQSGVQGQRGANTSWAKSDGVTGATWALTGQTGYYFDYDEPVIGAKNLAGSNFYLPVDLTLASNARVAPLVGPNTFTWYPMTFRLANVNEVISMDDVTDFRLGRTARARVLMGFEHARQRYWDPSRKGNLPAMTGASTADLATNYLRNNSAWSSTAWGPAPGNGHTALPNWGYGFSGFDQQNPGTLFGAGANRAYRGWNIYNLDTGERRAAQISGDEIDAIVERYYYGLSQDIFSDAAYLSGQFDLFNRRLSLLGAVRYARIEKKDYRVFDKVPKFPQRYDPLVPQVGVIYNINRDLNVYASYAKNYWYEWSRQTNALGEAPPANAGKSIEVGTKFSLFGGRVSGSLSAYQGTMHNLTWKDNTFDLTALDPVRYPAMMQTVDGAQQLVNQFGLSRFNGEVENKGVELNVQARPTERWDMVVSYSRIDSTIKRGAPWTVGLSPSGVPTNMASLWNKYQFKRAEGPLNGLEVGFGATYRDPVYVGAGYDQTSISQAEFVWKTPTFIRFDGTIAYPFKALGYNWRLQGNVRNIAERKNWTADGNFIPDGQGREFSAMLRVSF